MLKFTKETVIVKYIMQILVQDFFPVLLIFFLQNFARTLEGKRPRHRQEDNTELGLQKR
jgi:hypothetical protein